MSELKMLELRVAAIEADHKSIVELIDLLEEVKLALRVIIKISKVVKWLAGTLLAMSGIAWVIKHFGEGS